MLEGAEAGVQWVRHRRAKRGSGGHTASHHHGHEGKLKIYINLTLNLFNMPDGLTLELGTCAKAGFATLDPQQNRSGHPITTPWICAPGACPFGNSFAIYCASGDENTNYGADTTGCGCVIGLCPEVPPSDKPICAVCNAVSNRPREITFFIRGAAPPPPPPPDIFGFVHDVLRKTPELSTLYDVVQGAATKDSTGRPYERECPRGGQSPDCSFPSEESDGRQTFTGTIEEKGPWTFFAPDNAAFAKAPARKAGWQDGQNELFLDNNFDTLYYHLLPGNFSAAQLPNGESNTLLGADLTTSHLGKAFTFVTSGNTTNVARVKKSVWVTNGVVHIISAVLIPPVDTRPSKHQGYSTCCAARVAQLCCDACWQHPVLLSPSFPLGWHRLCACCSSRLPPSTSPSAEHRAYSPPPHTHTHTHTHIHTRPHMHAHARTSTLHTRREKRRTRRVCPKYAWSRRIPFITLNVQTGELKIQVQWLCIAHFSKGAASAASAASHTANAVLGFGRAHVIHHTQQFWWRLSGGLGRCYSVWRATVGTLQDERHTVRGTR